MKTRLSALISLLHWEDAGNCTTYTFWVEQEVVLRQADRYVLLVQGSSGFGLTGTVYLQRRFWPKKMFLQIFNWKRSEGKFPPLCGKG